LKITKNLKFESQKYIIHFTFRRMKFFYFFLIFLNITNSCVRFPKIFSIIKKHNHIHEWKRQSWKISQIPKHLTKPKKISYFYGHLSIFLQKRFNLVKKTEFSENKNFAFVLSRKMPLKQKREIFPLTSVDSTWVLHFCSIFMYLLIS